jgi:tRNA (cytidine32/uridine32-2'-O)-methyltransferase
VSIDKRQAKIRMVLVNTSHPGNIGGAARAMKNMGLFELYLVQPREYPAPRAVWRAAGARDVLDNVKVVESVDQAIQGCGLVIGTSARERRIPWPMMNPKQCGERIWQESVSHEVALLFGREDRGLTNSELHKCNYHVNIPSNPDYSSLNLATAVQVLAYEIRMASLADSEATIRSMEEWDQPLATSDDLELFHEHLANTMEEIKFYDPDNPKQLITRMRRLFNRSRMDKMEVSMLRGLLSAISRISADSTDK